MKILDKINMILELYLKNLTIQLEMTKEEFKINKYYEDIGKRFGDIIHTHAISEDELVSISEDVAEFVTTTRKTNIRDLLFDGDRPRYIKDGKVL